MTNQLGMFAITVILLCASLPVLATDQNYLCPTTSCDNTTTGIQIRFPFRLNTQPSYCGLPSPWFELSCRDNMTLLHVQPSPLEVYVVGIDYKGLVLKVNDTKGCSAGLLYNLNLSASPFKFHSGYRYDNNITFLDCSQHYTDSDIDPLPARCMNSPGHDIYYLRGYPMSSLPVDCFVTKTIQCSYFIKLDDQAIDLTWDLSFCRHCENKGGRCGFKKKTTPEIGCYGIYPNRGNDDNP